MDKGRVHDGQNWCSPSPEYAKGIKTKMKISGDDVKKKEKTYRERPESIWHCNQSYKSINERIRKQRGTFIFCGHSAKTVDFFIDDEFPEHTLLKISLPSSLQSKVLSQLSLMGLDSASLMADMEGLQKMWFGII